MNSKKALLKWSVLLMLLTSCFDEGHGYFTFKKNGSGVLNLEVLFPESSEVKDIKDCREALSSIDWNNISYEGSSSINNPSGGDQCRYIYSYNDLDEAEKLHKALLGFKLERLSIDDNYFTYKALDKTCVDDFVRKHTKSVTWSIKPPGNIRSHNAEKVIGDKLTWNLSGFDCYDISVVSALTQPADETTANKDLVVTEPKNKDSVVTEPNTSSPSEKTESEPVDATIVTWTTIGASIATIIATAIAYKESRKKK